MNDHGTEEQASVTRNGEVLDIVGTRYTGQAPLSAVTTSYYATPFLERRPWISTQSGDPLDVALAPVSGRRGWWAVTGELTTTLGYDQRGEWVGCEFPAGGETASYEPIGETGLIGAMWADA